MKEKVIKILEKDKIVKELLNEFMSDFNDAYNKRDDEEKEIIINFRDAIFRTWLNSPYINNTYITPNYIINNIAQHNIKGDYSIIPHIKMKIDKNNKINFETRWIYYSIENLPVIDDIDLLVKHSIPTLIVREENPLVVDNGEELIDKINFRSGYYINYLIDISLQLGILKEMKAIGCNVYQATGEYDDFTKLDNREKVKRIIRGSIELTNNILKQSQYINDLFLKKKKENITLNLLDNNIGEEYYYENMNLMAKDINSILNDIGSFTDDKEMIDEINALNDIFQVNMATELIKHEIGIYLDMNFLSVFGYYLGVINYSYESYFITEVLTELLLSAEDDMEKLGVIFNLDMIHDLTPLGETIIKDYKKKINKKSLNSIDMKSIENAIKYHYEEKEEILTEIIDSLLNKQIFDEDFNLFEDDILKDVSKPIVKHLEEFYDYLRDVKNLKESTCEKHVGNIELFIVHFLGITTKKEIGLINEEPVEYYLKDWFMHKVATSKNSIKEQISSIGQYAKFLEGTGYISKDTAKAIKNIMKDKDEYYNIFESLFDDLFI